MGVVRSSGVLFDTLKESRAAQASYKEERDRLASKILGMRDCSIAAVQVADVSEDKRIDKDRSILDSWITEPNGESLPDEPTTVRVEEPKKGKKVKKIVEKPEVKLKKVKKGRVEKATVRKEGKEKKPFKKARWIDGSLKDSLLFRLHDLVKVQRSKQNFLAAAARIGKKIVELRGALEGAVAARSANLS